MLVGSMNEFNNKFKALFGAHVQAEDITITADSIKFNVIVSCDAETKIQFSCTAPQDLTDVSFYNFVNNRFYASHSRLGRLSLTQF